MGAFLRSGLVNTTPKCKQSCRRRCYSLLLFKGLSTAMCEKSWRIFSAEKRSFCLQRSVFVTTIVEFIWLLENPVRTISASFGPWASAEYFPRGGKRDKLRFQFPGGGKTWLFVRLNGQKKKILKARRGQLPPLAPSADAHVSVEVVRVNTEKYARLIQTFFLPMYFNENFFTLRFFYASL